MTATDGAIDRASRWSGAKTVALTAVACVALVLMAIDVGFTPERFMTGMGRMGRLLATMFPPTSGGQTVRILKALAETMAMAFVGTIVAALLALPLGLIGAKTVLRQPALHFAIRRFLDFFRGVPALVWALILLSIFGLGPVAGVIALALADAPNLAKLFAEAIENVDRRPIEGVRSAGASPLQVMRLGVAPQVTPVMASQCLYYLEGNFRNAGVLGIVGAGGIGFELEERIRIFDFDTAAFIIIMYMIAVAALDTASRMLREKLS
jgi:phosphonate transport system permease protein